MNARQIKNLFWSSKSIYLFALFLLNPVVWFFNTRISGALPDTISYLVLADTIFQQGKLFVAHWGHIDSGLILPPVYPALISLGNYLSADSLMNAQFISHLSILLSTFPLFCFLANHTTRNVAFFAVLGIQLNYYYSFFGFAPLTEATFILALSTGFWLLSKALSNSKQRWLFFLGCFTCIVFLTRQIGGVFLLLTCLLFLPPFLKKNHVKRKAAKDLFAILTGFFIIMAPYSLVLFEQTGQLPFVQAFRLMEYAVSEDAAPAQKVSLEGLENQSSYYQTWVKRRMERQLIPDASEMYSYLTAEKKHSFVESALSKATDMERLTRNTANNLNFMKEATGLPLLLLFILTPISIRWIKTSDVPVNIRLILPGFILLYVTVVTLLSGSVGRYLYVLFPFIYASVLMESYFTFRFMREHITAGLRPEIMSILLCALIILSTPEYFTSIDFRVRADEYSPLIKECGKHINSDDPVFSTHQNNVHLLGGKYRVLPNDSLERISAYAEKTGVKWLFFVGTEADQYELYHYFLSGWRNQLSSLHETHPGFVSLQCAHPEKSIYLYKFTY